jgi:hypothetical protein
MERRNSVKGSLSKVCVSPFPIAVVKCPRLDGVQRREVHSAQVLEVRWPRVFSLVE